MFYALRLLVGRISVVSMMFLSFSLALSPLAAQSTEVIATFHSIGIYWSPRGAGESRAALVQYRPVGEAAWQDGYPLWYSQADNQYRGSLVHLTPGTEYEIRLTLAGTNQSELLTATTWSENFPIAQTIELPELSTKILRIEESGSPTGYILYTHAPGQTATIDGNGRARANIFVDASYIIIRGLTLRDAKTHGIWIGGDAHDIVIEGNDISGWGEYAYPGTHFGKEGNAAVYSATSSENERFIIQHNTIHHPRTDTNSWSEERKDIKAREWGTHPAGPAAIFLFNSGGNHVIRYNTIYSDDEHQFNDCFGGGANFSDIGSPNRDSDIYGNYISHCWDNSIEAEGANRNVRIWGNYTEETYHAIANRDTNIGPLYIWRNVIGSSRREPRELVSWDDDPRGSFQKAGAEEGNDHGVFVFHNTILQPTGDPELEHTIGVGVGLGGPMQDTTTRNNILQVYCEDCESISVDGDISTNDFDYDLYNGFIDDPAEGEANGVFGVPIYSRDFGFSYAAYDGVFTLDPSSPGYDQGVILPNFNSGYFTGLAPDMGAHEAGTPPMEFGTSAYLHGEPYEQAAANTIE